MHKDKEFFETIGNLVKETGKISSLIFTLLSSSNWKVNEHSRSIYSRSSLVKLLVVVKLLNIPTVNMAIGGFDLKGLLPFGKDVLYKVKNSVNINWRKMLLKQSYDCLQSIDINHTSTKSDQVPCFVIDDTDIPKTGRKIEFIGRIFSHVGKGYNLGFKSLNLAYWTGINILHIDFSYHVEMGKKKNQGLSKKELRSRYTKERDTSSLSTKRIEETLSKKTDNAIKMIKRAIKKGFKAQYILADSWFFNKALAQYAKKVKVHLISRPKFNNWKYEYKEKHYTIGQLVKKLRYTKNKKWSRKLHMNYIRVKVNFQDTEMVLCFFKEKKRNVKWQALISTDGSITAIKAYEIYQNRWTIETSFKELKQLLKYGKTQSQDFDAHISDATHTLIAFNYLSTVKAVNSHQTIGELFRDVSAKWVKPNMMKKFWNSFFQAIKEISVFLTQSIDELIELVTKNNNFLSSLKNLTANLSAET